MKKIKQQLLVISKTPYERSIIKTIWSQEFDILNQKHLNRILTCLAGNGDIQKFDAFQLLMLYVQNLNPSKWVKSLKLLLLIHVIIDQRGKEFTESFNSAEEVQRLNFTSIVSQDQISQIHSMLAIYYFRFLKVLSKCYFKINNLYKQKGLSVLDQDFTKKILPELLEIAECFLSFFKWDQTMIMSLQRFEKVIFMKQIAALVYKECNKMNEIIKSYILDKIELLTTLKPPHLTKFYELYSKFHIITKNLKGFIVIKNLIKPLNIDQEIQLFTITQEKNREIELYYNQFSQLQHNKKPSLTVHILSNSNIKQSSVSKDKQNEQLKSVKSESNLYIPNQIIDSNNENFKNMFINNDSLMIRQKQFSNNDNIVDKQNLLPEYQSFHTQTDQLIINDDDFDINQNVNLMNSTHKNNQQLLDLDDNNKKLNYYNPNNAETNLLLIKSNSNKKAQDTISKSTITMQLEQQDPTQQVFNQKDSNQKKNLNYGEISFFDKNCSPLGFIYANQQIQDINDNNQQSDNQRKQNSQPQLKVMKEIDKTNSTIGNLLKNKINIQDDQQDNNNYYYTQCSKQRLQQPSDGCIMNKQKNNITYN